MAQAALAALKPNFSVDSIADITPLIQFVGRKMANRSVSPNDHEAIDAWKVIVRYIMNTRGDVSRMQDFQLIDRAFKDAGIPASCILIYLGEIGEGFVSSLDEVIEWRLTFRIVGRA